MTAVTDVTYGNYSLDHDDMTLTVYTVPSENYRPGMSEDEAQAVATRVDEDPSAPGARGIENYRRDTQGIKVPGITTCGTCGRIWEDGLITGITPTPAGRCPWEYLHEDDEGELQ